MVFSRVELWGLEKPPTLPWRPFLSLALLFLSVSVLSCFPQRPVRLWSLSLLAASSSLLLSCVCAYLSRSHTPARFFAYSRDS